VYLPTVPTVPTTKCHAVPRSKRNRNTAPSH
jgi:hypothetical protein